MSLLRAVPPQGHLDSDAIRQCVQLWYAHKSVVEVVPSGVVLVTWLILVAVLSSSTMFAVLEIMRK